MKKIFSVLLTTLFLLSVVIWSQIYSESTLKETSGKIDYIVEHVANIDDINDKKTIELIDDLDKYWTKKEHILCLSINHNDLNKIGEQIKRVKIFMTSNDKENCQCELSVLAFYAQSYIHVIDTQFENLF